MATEAASSLRFDSSRRSGQEAKRDIVRRVRWCLYSLPGTPYLLAELAVVNGLSDVEIKAHEKVRGRAHTHDDPCAKMEVASAVHALNMPCK